MIVRIVDIGGIDDNDCFNFLFIRNTRKIASQIWGEGKQLHQRRMFKQ